MTGDETAMQRAILATPLGEPLSGIARYAAAMYFYKAGAIGRDELEVFRICARLDRDDPRDWAESRGVDWSRVEAVLAGNGSSLH